MTRPDALRIADIVAACQELSPIRSIGYDAFTQDQLLQRAAERLIEIIGEAATRLSEETRNQYPLIPWHRIRRVRIVMAHEYFRINADQIWETLDIHVPILLVELMPKPESE